MRFLNKKIPIGVVLVVVFAVAALVYSLGYKMAMDKFNNVISYNQEKQKIYSKLSELDYNIRKECIVPLNEDKLLESLCSGYISGMNDKNCRFFKPEDYKAYKSEQENIKGIVTCDMIGGNIGYICCQSLGQNFSKLFTDEFSALVSDGINEVIIDLRGTQGGDENEVFKVFQYLIPDGNQISAVDNKGERKEVCKSSSQLPECKIAVLIDNQTSGPAEIIASALKDVKTAGVIGVPTSGSAVRVKSATLSDDTVLIFPDAYYVTQGNESIFGKGVQPNIVSEMDPKSLELFEKHELPDEQDNQLQEAIKFLS